MTNSLLGFLRADTVPPQDIARNYGGYGARQKPAAPPPPKSGPPSPVVDSKTSPGGIGRVTAQDGNFYQDGKQVNLSMLMMNLMIHRVQSVDGVLGGMISQMNQNNVTTKNMNNFLNGLRELRPTTSGGTVSWNKLYNLQEKVFHESGNRAFPNTAWGLNLKRGDSLKQNQVDQLIEVMKSKISSVNSNQQMEQIKLEKYNNVRNESMQMVSTVMKTQTQSLQGIINNMG